MISCTVFIKKNPQKRERERDIIVHHSYSDYFREIKLDVNFMNLSLLAREYWLCGHLNIKSSIMFKIFGSDNY